MKKETKESMPIKEGVALKESVVDENSKTMSKKGIRFAIVQFFEMHKLNYKLDKAKESIITDFPLRGKLKHVDVIVRTREDSFTVMAILRINAGEECLNHVAEYLTRANYGLINGNFELDYRDGEIRYKTHTECGNCIPDENAIGTCLFLPLLMFDRYGDGLLSVMFGIKTPAEAVAEAEAKKEEDLSEKS